MHEDNRRKQQLSMLPVIGLVALLGFAGTVSAAEPQDVAAQAERENQTRVADLPRGVVRLDETVISGNQELPKVLYILPWREPQGLPRIELEAKTASAEVFRRLYPPAYRRELGYFETLRGLDDDTGQHQKE